MRLFCLLTCVVLLSACRMKDPAEGVLRLRGSPPMAVVVAKVEAPAPGSRTTE